jgi:hypothetical protein
VKLKILAQKSRHGEKRDKQTLKLVTKREKGKKEKGIITARLGRPFWYCTKSSRVGDWSRDHRRRLDVRMRVDVSPAKSAAAAKLPAGCSNLPHWSYCLPGLSDVTAGD